jgi:hypothetical protein
MSRSKRMAAVVPNDKEPITPLIAKIKVVHDPLAFPTFHLGLIEPCSTNRACTKISVSVVLW